MAKWQPVILIVEKRLECVCGNLAIFVVIDNYEKREGEEKEDMDYTAWCQDCWEHAQEEESEE